MGEANYASGDEYVVEFLGYRFGFNAEDFEERIVDISRGRATVLDEAKLGELAQFDDRYLHQNPSL